ncbi:unnamed protein product [Schistosoma margrebowiei]|uniref:Uncharacterized protein n=1 Tax=Schistosoma margrebowiei TaxID=48269 RepID=A0A183MTA3_9TREM|nr:unnamed protein product [Schistosoma margrebowiei]
MSYHGRRQLFPQDTGVYRMWSMLAVTATSAFSASAVMLSDPTALLLLICLMTMPISSTVGGQHWDVRGCCFNVGWIQWGWSIQEFFEVFYPPVSLFIHVGDYFAYLAFHWSFWSAAIFREFLC